MITIITIMTMITMITIVLSIITSLTSIIYLSVYIYVYTYIKELRFCSGVASRAFPVLSSRNHQGALKPTNPPQTRTAPPECHKTTTLQTLHTLNPKPYILNPNWPCTLKPMARPMPLPSTVDPEPSNASRPSCSPTWPETRFLGSTLLLFLFF